MPGKKLASGSRSDDPGNAEERQEDERLLLELERKVVGQKEANGSEQEEDSSLDMVVEAVPVVNPR